MGYEYTLVPILLVKSWETRFASKADCYMTFGDWRQKCQKQIPRISTTMVSALICDYTVLLIGLLLFTCLHCCSTFEGVLNNI